MHILKDLKKTSKKALIITAHPDDESFFMGGTIAEFKKWRWTIFCVTGCDERHNKRRRLELLRACRIYNRKGSRIKPLMLGIVKKKGRFSKSEIAKRLRDYMDEFGPFDIIFTHNAGGDYGHKTHRLIHDIVKRLRLANVYNFCIPTLKKSASTILDMRHFCIQAIELSSKSRRIKRQALNIYLKGSQKTNLSRLKRLLTYAFNTKIELFYYN